MAFDANAASADTGFYARYMCGYWAEQGFAILSGL